MATATFRGLLTANPRTVLAWRTSKAILLQINSHVTDLGVAPASCLPRMRLTFGLDGGRQEIIADLPSFKTICLIGPGSIDVFADQDDLLTPTAMSSPTFNISVNTAPGWRGPAKLEYTYQPMVSSADSSNFPVPNGAVSVRAIRPQTTAPPYDPALPGGWLGIRTLFLGAGPGGILNTQRWDINDLIKREYPIQSQAGLCRRYAGTLADSVLWKFYTTGGAGVNTEPFRVIFGLEI